VRRKRNRSSRQISSTAYNNRFLFTGREYGPFGFYEYRARAYNPQLGRFMSEDPKLFDAGDYNLFRYCHNDPIDMTDPMGLSPGDSINWPPTGSHIPQALSLDNLAAMELVGLHPTFGQAAQSAMEGRNLTMGQTQSATANRPDPSKYAAGEPYSARRSPQNLDRQLFSNGHIGRAALIYIKFFDRDGRPVPTGTVVSEIAVPTRDERFFVREGEEHKYFQSYTDPNGQLHHADLWKHSFSSPAGSVVQGQTLEARGNHLHWTATVSAKSGVEISPYQTGYFLQRGDPGY
jgi:RHS repeat-associated protein